VFSEPRAVEEIIEFHTSVSAAGVLCRTKLSCSFVTPVVKFSEEAINFRVEMVRTVILVVSRNCFVFFCLVFWGLYEPGYYTLIKIITWLLILWLRIEDQHFIGVHKGDLTDLHWMCLDMCNFQKKNNSPKLE